MGSVILQDESKLSFRQRPVLKDCFPASSKQYQTVEHANGPIQVCNVKCLRRRQL